MSNISVLPTSVDSKVAVLNYIYNILSDVLSSEAIFIKCFSPVFRLSPAAYYAQRMIQYLSRRDSIRQRSMRYQQNRLRSSSSSASTSESSGPSVEGNDLDFEDFE